jgi:hypothetical protein
MSVPAADGSRSMDVEVKTPLRAGWTVSLREGTDLRVLLSLAVERMKNGFAAHELKGVA